jgi:hypothetical protein
MKLSLRELLLFVALAAMGCGWWGEWSRRHVAESNVTEQSRIAEHWRGHAMIMAAYLQSLDLSVMMRDEHGNEVKPPHASTKAASSLGNGTP